VLWGGWFIVNSKQGFAHASNMVAVEADGSDPATTTPGRYTFYGRYDGWTAVDHREPLSTNFAVRYVTGGVFSGGTSLLVWRDSKVNQGAFTCPATTGRPAWYPLGQEGIVIFDEQEQPVTPSSSPVSPPPVNNVNLLCTAEAQRTKIGGADADFPVPYDFGWIYADLNTTVTVAPNAPPEDPAAAQAWITDIMDASGRFSVGLDAIQLDSACAALHFTPGGG